MPVTIINIILLIVLVYLFINKKTIAQYNVTPLLIIVGVNLIAELSAFYLSSYHIKGGSAWVYNLSLPIEFLCYGLIYKKLFRRTFMYYFIIGSVILIPVIGLICFYYYNSIFRFYTPMLTGGCIFLMITTLTFFIKLFNADYFQTNPLKLFFFWLSMALLLCYLGGFMYLSNLNYLFYKFEFLYANLKILNFILNCFLYLCIIIAVECLKHYRSLQIQSF